MRRAIVAGPRPTVRRESAGTSQATVRPPASAGSG